MADGPTPETPLPYPADGAQRTRRGLGVAMLVGGVALLALGAYLVIGGGPILLLIPIVLAAVGLGGAGIYFAVIASKAIAAMEQAWIAKRGWGWTKSDTADRPNRFLGFRPFGQGHTRVARDVVTGTYWGVPFEAFNYSYQVTHTTTDSKGHTTTHTTTYPFAIVAIPMPLASPGLTLEPETLGKKIFDALGGEDIDFESDDFSRKFWVRCTDRRFAYDCIDGRMMEHLMAVGNQRTWEWRGDRLLVYTTGRLGIRDLDLRLWEAQGAWSRIPRHLLGRPTAKALA